MKALILCLILWCNTMKAESFNFRISLPPNKLQMNAYYTVEEWYLHYNLSSTLFYLNAKNKVVSGLAKSWKYNHKGDEVTIELKPNLKWSDGQPVLIEEVLTNIFWAPKQNNSNILLQKYRFKSPRKSVLKLSKNTFKILLKAPYSKLLHQLSRPELGLVDWSQFKNDNFTIKKRYRYSGDYKPSAINAQKMELQKNTFSNTQNKLSPEKVTFIKNVRNSNLNSLIEKSEIDFFELVDPKHIKLAKEAAYSIKKGALDNLLTIQSRKLNPNQKRALNWLRSEYLKEVKTPTGSIKASSIYYYTESTYEFKKGELPKKISPFSLRLGAKATEEERSIAKKIGSIAKKNNIPLEILFNEKGFHEKWFNENYESTVLTMGTFGVDEAELWNGYFCSGFQPYKMLSKACSGIKKAINQSISPKERLNNLNLAYESIDKLNLLLPLYFKPRFYAVSSKWKFSGFNRRLPYPYVRNIRSTSAAK